MIKLFLVFLWEDLESTEHTKTQNTQYTIQYRDYFTDFTLPLLYIQFWSFTLLLGSTWLNWTQHFNILWAFANIIRAEPNKKTLANMHGEAFVLLLVSWGLGLGGRKLGYIELCIKQFRLCANLDCNNKIRFRLTSSPLLWKAIFC